MLALLKLARKIMYGTRYTRLKLVLGVVTKKTDHSDADFSDHQE